MSETHAGTDTRAVLKYENRGYSLVNGYEYYGSNSRRYDYLASSSSSQVCAPARMKRTVYLHGRDSAASSLGSTTDKIR